VRYFCGGAWGQEEDLTAADVAKIVTTTPGPHYVWAEGMTDWVSAETVPEILEAMASFGGTTVPPETSSVALFESQKSFLELHRRKVISLSSTVFCFVLFLVCAVVFWGDEPAKAQVTGPAERTNPKEVTAEPVVEPSTPAPPPRMDAVSRRPLHWTNKPLLDPRRRTGTAQASSELREGGGKLHGARNVADQRSSTAWCEGNPQSDGEGEWLQLAVPCVEADFRELIGIEVVSGFTDKVGDWSQNNRPSKAMLTLTIDGRVMISASAFLADRPGYQFLEFPRSFLCQSGETARVKLDIEQLYTGETYSDACLSGLALYERKR
jgi:hypothetical protein